MSASGAAHAHTRSLRVVTYNIHKGVQGVWPSQRLEIHNLQHAIASLHAAGPASHKPNTWPRRATSRFT